MYLNEISAVYSREPIRSTKDAANLLRIQFSDFDREYMYVINLTASGRPISYHMVGIGCTNAVTFPIMTTFRTAIIQNAVSIILCHNHPGGTLIPSEEDIAATKQMIEAGQLLGIKVLDHFIFTPQNYLSMREVMPEIF